MKLSKPIEPSIKEIASIAISIRAIFVEAFYKPLFKELRIKANMSILQNAVQTKTLSHLLSSGLTYYENGVFRGQMSVEAVNEIKQMGGVYNKILKGYATPYQRINPQYQKIIYNVNKRGVARLQALSDKITLLPIIINKFVAKDKILNIKYMDVVDRLDNEFVGQTEKLLGIKPQLTQAEKEIIAKDYTNNLKTYINKFAEEEMIMMRKLVAQNFKNGNRPSQIISFLTDRLGVTDSKAKFLAEQETKLMTASFTKARFTEVGATKFKWRSANDSRVRELHRQHNGKIFDFDNPPIIDENTGQRGLPNQAFGCRCVMSIVIE